MGRLLFGLMVVGVSLPAVASADTDKNHAIKMDRKRIEGVWRITAFTVDGKNSTKENLSKLLVVNGSDGTWSVRVDDKEVAKGTSTFDPTNKPKTIDFKPTEDGGKGKRQLGIYELGENTRKLCFAPTGHERPSEFSSKVGSKHTLVTFQRVKAD